MFLVNIEDDGTAFLMVVCVSDYSYQKVRQLVRPYYNKTMYCQYLVKYFLAHGNLDDTAVQFYRGDSLMKQCVDSTWIILDYDDTRTLNSIAKMRDVYSQYSIIIISQKYHNERALYQAKHLGIEAIAFYAKTPGRSTSWWRNRGREVLARVKLIIDITRGLHPDIKESVVRDFTNVDTDVLTVSHVTTKYGDLIFFFLANYIMYKKV